MVDVRGHYLNRSDQHKHAWKREFWDLLAEKRLLIELLELLGWPKRRSKYLELLNDPDYEWSDPEK